MSTETIRITVELSDDQFDRLLTCCRAEGRTVETVAADILNTGVRAYLAQQRRAADLNNTLWNIATAGLPHRVICGRPVGE